jgi:hypothetical protein
MWSSIKDEFILFESKIEYRTALLNKMFKLIKLRDGQNESCLICLKISFQTFATIQLIRLG